MVTSVAVAACLIAGCSSEDDEPPVTVEETTTTTALETTTTADAASNEAVMRNEVVMIEPPDETAFLDKLRQREPSRMAEFEDVELVELGVVSCNATQGYVHGSSPNPGDELVAEMTRRGHPVELSEAIAPDIRNSVEGTICEVTRVAE